MRYRFELPGRGGLEIAVRLPAWSLTALPLLIGATSPSRTEIYTAQLRGDAEASVINSSSVAGDPDASGRVRITIDAAREQVCYDFDLNGISTPMMAHIHRAPAFRNGPTVVTLFTGLGGDLDDCVRWTPKQLAAIVADPSSYYVNIYTTEFPDGALRGQLG